MKPTQESFLKDVANHRMTGAGEDLEGRDVNRDEHLAWCKQRALEYLDRGEVREGFTSMLSDLSKHPDTRDHIGGKIGVGFMMLPGWIDNEREVRRWIVGFN